MRLDRDTVLAAVKLLTAATATTVANRKISVEVNKLRLPLTTRVAVWLVGTALGNLIVKRLATRT